MKKTRLIAMLLLLAMLLSLLATTGLAASPAVTVAANSQPRHTVCTALSEAAQTYYTGDYQYETLKALPGADSTDSYAATQNNPLYTRLHTLMSSTRNDTRVVYGGTSADSLATYWQYTDAVGGTVGYQYFYADLSGNSYGTSSMQREHVWPQSKASYFQLNGGADLHHLRPSIGGVNQSKSNRAFADLIGTDTAYSSYQVNGQDVIWNGTKSFDNVLEVRDNVKGDVARILLYMYVRWQQPNLYSDVASANLPAFDSDDKSNSGVRVIEDRATLLRWCKLDPVDTWEMERNDLVQNVQGNRNVFIDYPELAWYLFGLTPPNDMQTPSGDAAASSGETATIQAVSSDLTLGTVSVSGNVITASPKAGCYVTGYTILSGSATVVRDGDRFTVTADASCTIRIEFAEHTYTVTFSVPDGVTAIAAQTCGASGLTLPTPEGTPSDTSQQYAFVGWVTSVCPTTTQKPDVLTAGAAFRPTEDCTLYALYAYGKDGGDPVYRLVSEAPDDWSGSYLIVNPNMDYAMSSTLANGRFAATAVTVTDNAVTNPAPELVFTFAKQNDGTYTVRGTTGYLKIGANNTSGGAVTDAAEDTFKIVAKAGAWQLTSTTTGSRCFAYYSKNHDFRTYASSTYKTGYLFRAGAASTTYYTTNPTVSDGSLTDENLKFFGKTVIFEADFSIKYYVPKAVVDTYDSVYVSVTKSVYDADGNVTGKKTTKVDVTDYNSGYNAYGFKFAGIAAPEVGSNVDATVYGVKDGKTYEGATQSGYSVKQYCYNTLSKANTTAANKRVLVDFLNYASAAQVYFNINTKNLVNAELTDEQKAFGTATVAAIGNDRADGTVANATVAVSGCTLIFEGKIMMKFVFDPATYLKNGGSLSDLSVVVKDADGKVLKTFAAADFADYGTRKSVVFDGLASTEMRKAVTFQVMVGDTAVSNSRTYSIQSYAYSMQNNAAQGTLVQDMIKYGDSMVAWKIG